MTVGASNASGERFRLFERAMVPQSNSIKEGYALSHTSVSGDNLAVDVPTAAAALAGGRAFAGISAAQGTVNVSYDNSITVQKAGIAKCALKANTACTAGTEAGYDPADGGPVQPVTPLNAGVLVVIGRFTQTKSSSSSEQFVGVELHAHEAGASERVLGAITSSSSAVTNTTTETAFDRTVPVPAGRLNAAGTFLRIHATARVTGGNGNDTLQLKCRFDSAAGDFIGQTPAVDVTNTAGDRAVLDLVLFVRSAGATGSYVSSGLGGISPGQAVATGGNVQTTGTTVVNFDFTAARTLVVTATWSAASASNTVVLDELTVTIFG
ncbi:MAG: hypothetical protein U1A78_32200 [Polyangia bacterium]